MKKWNIGHMRQFLASLKEEQQTANYLNHPAHYREWMNKGRAADIVDNADLVIDLLEEKISELENRTNNGGQGKTN